MPLHFQSSTQQKITVPDKPLSTGGEGQVHKITAPSSYQSHCVKIFHPDKRTKQREQKIIYMIKNPPPDLNSEQYKICWPVELIYENKQFVGFIMPLAYDGSIELYQLCLLNINLAQNWHRFDRNISDGILLRQKLCVNIASIIHQIHSLNCYVLVDMKPQNILVSDTGKISIIDLDSIQIANGTKVIHYSHAATPEYIPPEGQVSKKSKKYIPVSWDRFSLAVIIYEILFGLHPFTAVHQGKYKECNELSEKIKYGLFAQSNKLKKILKVPPPHNNFDKIPNSLKQLFFEAFEKGHRNPKARPSAEKWGETIFQLVKEPPKPPPKPPLISIIKKIMRYVKNTLLFPFVLTRAVIKTIVEVLVILSFLIIAILKTIVGTPVVVFLYIFVIGIMLPLKIVVYLLSFSYINLWKDSLFSMPEKVGSWVEEAWDFKAFHDSYIK